MEKILETEVIEEGTLIVKPVTNIQLTEGIDLQALLEEYSSIPIIDLDADDEVIGEQYRYVLSGHKTFVKARNKIEKVRKAIKAPIIDFGREVDNRAKVLALSIIDKEKQLFIQRDKVEKAEERKMQIAIDKEQDRIKGIRSIIEAMQGLPMAGIGAKSSSVKQLIEGMEVPTEDFYEEFTEEATAHYKHVMIQLETLFKTAQRAENADKIANEQRVSREAEEAILEKSRKAEMEAFKAEKAEFEVEKKAMREHQNMLEAIRQAEELEKKEAEESKKAESLKLQNEMEAENRLVAIRQDIYADMSKHYESGSNEEDGIANIVQAIFNGEISHVSLGV